MSTPSENTYGNILMEERYKKLERTLKILLLNKKKSSDVNSPDPVWPCVSSINGDPLDTSCTGFSVHSSRIGSVVVASSRDMRKMQSRSKLSDNPQKMTTSSVKQFSTKTDQTERVLMPPPKGIGILAHSSRRNSLTGSSLPKSNPQSSSGTDHGHAAQSVISSIKASSSGRDISRIDFEKENRRDHHKTEVDVKPDRIFSKWRPVLNDKGQLVIKGTLECGKIARSKPVIRRLSSVSVQSVFNHIYHLRGTIYDERQELPDYIRGKFYNGFPDDWENVYQVWSNFIAGGCSESFRWPTPITDSDDDLMSGITDVTQVRNPRKRLNLAKEVKQDDIRLSPRKYSASMKTRRDNFHEEILRENNSLTSRKCLNSNDDSRDRSSEGRREDKKSLSPRRRLDLSRDKREIDQNDPKTVFDQNKSCYCIKESNPKCNELDEPNDTIENFMNKIKYQQMNSSSASLTPSAANRPSMGSLKDIIHEDKLKIILENLTSKKCSIEYIDKMLEMFDCLKYVMSYQSDNPASDSPHTQGPQTSKNTSRVHREPTKRDTPYPQDNRKDPPKPSNPPEVHETHLRKRNLPVKRTLSKNDYDSSDPHDDSEEDRRPKLSLRPLKRREKPLDQLRSTEKRRRHSESTASDSEDEMTSPKKKYSSYPPQAHPEVKNQRKIFKMPGQPLINYDSSVSLTEDERRPPKSRPHFVKSRERTVQTRAFQPDNYDSSVSLTEDEFGDDYRRRAEAKRNILQEANAKIVKSPDDCIKRNHPKGLYQRDLPPIVEKAKREETHPNHQNHPNDDKENQKSSVPHRDEETFPEINNEEIPEKPVESQCSEKKKKKPTIVNIEKVTVTIPQVLTKSSSQSSNNDQNPLKKDSSQDPRKDPKDPIKPKSAEVERKDLRVELQDILKDKDSVKPSGSKTIEGCKKGEFGTESNPKLLTAWVPRLLKKPGGNYGIIFEGKLLNEAGHIASRRFSTDFILRRANPQVVETEAHEFYQLTGDLSDTKHTVPKEIQKMCLKGCPGRIHQFCEKWRKLIEEQYPEKKDDHNTTIDMIGVPTSSRGRRILPPLCYWNGERITLKDNTPVYSPGNIQESSIPSSFEMSFRKDVSQNSSRKKDTSVKDSSMSSALNNTNSKKNEKSAKKEELAQSSSKPEERSTKSKKSPVKLKHVGKSLRSTSKRRLPRDVKNDSSDPEEIEKDLRVKRRRGRRGEAKSPVKEREERKEESKSKETGKGRNREKDPRGRSEKPKELSSGFTCTYRTNVPYRDNDLSDDQLSTM